MAAEEEEEEEEKETSETNLNREMIDHIAAPFVKNSHSAIPGLITFLMESDKVLF